MGIGVGVEVVDDDVGVGIPRVGVGEFVGLPENEVRSPPGKKIAAKAIMAIRAIVAAIRYVRFFFLGLLLVVSTAKAGSGFSSSGVRGSSALL